jgi:outer membrane protein assembly factor BamB
MSRHAAFAALASILTVGCVGVDLNSVRHLAPGKHAWTKVLAPSWHSALVLGTDRTYNPFEGSTPAADPDRGRIYVGTSTGRFYALRSEDGARLWTFDTKEAIHSTPVLSADREVVYFGNEAGWLYALDADTGEKIWSYEATAEIRCRPLLHKQILLLRDVRGKVHAVDSQKGSGLWLYRGELPEGHLIGSSAGVGLASGRVLAGFSDGTALGLKLLDGSVSWTADLSEFLPGDAITGDEKLDVNTTPVVIDAEHVVFSSFRGGLFSLDPRSGSILWRRSDVPRTSGLALQGGRIYVAMASKGVMALDTDGRTIWRSHFSSGTISDPMPHGSRLYMTDSKFGLIVLSRSTGQVLDRFTPAWGASASPLVRAGRAFFVSNGGHLYAFHLKDAKKP